MKKILGILAICFVGLFMLASCSNDKATEPAINEPDVNEIQDSGTVLFDIATAKQTQTYTDIEGNSYEFVYTVMVRALAPYYEGSVKKGTTVDIIARNATKLTQYDNYFVLEYCYVDHGDVFKVVEVYSNTMNAYFYSTL